MPAEWSAHTSPDGKTYYFDRISGTSTWTKPASFARTAATPTLQSCLDSSPAVAALFNAIVKHCGADAIPTVTTRPVVSSDGTEDRLCGGGRGGGFCCKSRHIFICSHTWTSCREVAYELSHALNACRGLTHCRGEGMTVDGKDCGYLGPPDVACSELRASYWTGRCVARAEGPKRTACMEWHARWATNSCYPDDENLEAHVRHASKQCTPNGADATLTNEAPPSGGVATTFAEQAHRW